METAVAASGYKFPSRASHGDATTDFWNSLLARTRSLLPSQLCLLCRSSRSLHSQATRLPLPAFAQTTARQAAVLTHAS